jgi:hypothetical protein
MLTKTKTYIRIKRKDWERLRSNPAFSEMVELLEDQADFEKAKKMKGKDVTLEKYMKRRGLSYSS